VTKEDILKTIFSAVDEVNLQLPQEHRIKKDPQADIYSENGGLDSLGLVNFIVILEEKIGDSFGKTPALANEKTMSLKDTPFRNADILSGHILEILKNA